MKDTDPTSAPAGWAVAAIGPTGSAATVTVHDLSIPAEDADDPMVILNPEIHATIQFPGAAAFSCRHQEHRVEPARKTHPTKVLTARRCNVYGSSCTTPSGPPWKVG